MDNIRITIDTNAADAAKTFEQLSKSFDDSTKSSEDLRKQIKGLKDDLYKLTPGTEEYGQVLQDLGGKMDQLSDTQQELRVATGGLDAVFQSTTNATASMAAGFTAVTGVVSLFGGDTEDLQKTFVKLQAVMAIMNGLKGFAGFGKVTKQASTSLKAYISQLGIARKATTQQTTATAAMATSEGAATTATVGLSGAVRGLTAAIAANPIGAVLVAITAAVAAIVHFVSASKAAKEQTEEYNKVLEKSKGLNQTLVDKLNAEDISFSNHITRLKTLGETQENLNEATKKYYENEASHLRHRKETLEWYIDYNKANTGAKEKLEEWAKELEEVNGKLADVNGTLQNMAASTLPDWAQAIDEGYSALDKKLSRLVTAGLLTETGKIKQEIQYNVDEINKLNEKLSKAKIKRNLPNNSVGVNTELDALITEYTQTISKLERMNEKLNESLLDENAKTQKAVRENTAKLRAEYKKSADDFFKKISNELEEYSLLEQIIGKDKTEARMSAKISAWYTDFQKTLVDIVSKAHEVKMPQGTIDKLYEDFAKYEKKFKDLLADKNFDFKGWPPGIELMEVRLRSAANAFTSLNEEALKKLKDGKITLEEYNSWLLKYSQSHNTQMDILKKQAKELIENTLNSEEFKDLTDKEKETLANQWMELFEQSAKLVPQDAADNIKNALMSIIQKAYDETKYESQSKLDALSSEMEHIYKEWSEGGMFGKSVEEMQGKSFLGRFFTGFFGTEPSVAAKQAKKYINEWYDLLYQQYDDEEQYILDQQKLHKDNAEEYEKYNKQLAEIQAKRIATQQQQEEENLKVEREQVLNYAEVVKGATEVLGSLFSSMEGYYAEQAEQAKKKYGEESEEYQKYIKKEGNMKIAQVWSDAAMGIMSAWASYSKIPVYGNILAAAQSAILVATAIASTQQIKRQSKANASGGSSTANVGQLTDRVIMADAQNTDQTAQLNAQYNQGSMRVYVTQNDIENANNENRVAVTSNKF